MTISRQMAYQRRHNEQGLCKLCPRPTLKAGLCEDHYVKHLALNRRYRRNHSPKILVSEDNSEISSSLIA